MPFPHVFQRSGRRGGRRAAHEAPDQAAVARQIAAQLGTLLDRAEGADLQLLAHLIESARAEAERVVAQPASANQQQSAE